MASKSEVKKGTITPEITDGENTVPCNSAVKIALDKATYPYLVFEGTATVTVGASYSSMCAHAPLYAGNKVKISVDKSNFPSDITYLGCQVRSDDNTVVKNNTQSVFTIDSFDCKYFTLAFFFNGSIATAFEIPYVVEILYPSPYDIELLALLNSKSGEKYISRFSGHDKIFEIDFIAQTIKTNAANIFLFDSNAKINRGHGEYIQLNEGTSTFENEGADTSFLVPHYLILDKTHRKIRMFNYYKLYSNSENISFDIIGFGSIANDGKNFIINCKSPYKINGKDCSGENIYFDNSKDMASDGYIPVGTSQKKFKGFTERKIYGLGSSVSLLHSSEGDYYNPAIEISAGGISNISVTENGGPTDHSAYCVHNDSDNSTGKSLIIDNCVFKSNSGPCWGVGTRNGYELKFVNCVFIQENEDVTAFYSHNTSVNGAAHTPENKSKIQFINCVFIAKGSNAIKIQDWMNNTDYCEFTFIGCTVSSSAENLDDSVNIEYRGYPTEEFNSHVFKNKLSLSGFSRGNNVSWLNYSVD